MLGVGRTRLYVKPCRLAARDEAAVERLRAVHEANPYYGVERLAIELDWSEAKTRRIRDLADIHIPRPSKKHRTGKVAPGEVPAPDNALKPYARFKNESRPQDGQSYAGMARADAWVQDFTYIWFNGCWHYLAVVLDLQTRQVLGWALGLRPVGRVSAA